MKPFFTGKYATLFNHAADAEIARELIQAEATPDRFAAELSRLLDDPAARADQSARQTAALDLMGREGRDPSEIAAETLYTLLRDAPAGVRTGA
jgi:lipid-A-disaccharide synthase